MPSRASVFGMTPSNIVHEYEFQVLEMHLDTFSHMNHATYLTLFEQARWDWITKRGFGLSEIQQRQIGPTILEAKIKYKRELRLRENIKVISVCNEWKGKIGTLSQRMVNAAGEDCAEVELTFGFFDMNKRRLIQATPEWLHAIGVQT